MIELCHIYKSFGTRKILHDVNLSVNKGETMVVLGASGSGKSTILRLVMGLMRPDSGQVLVEGHDIALMNEEELNRQRSSMGMVFQYSALFDSMTIGDNVAFGLRQHTEMTENEIRSVVKEKLSLVGLEGTEDLMPSSLSGGMKKE